MGVHEGKGCDACAGRVPVGWARDKRSVTVAVRMMVFGMDPLPTVHPYFNLTIVNCKREVKVFTVPPATT